MVGRAALTESASVETFAAAAARSDTETGVPRGWRESANCSTAALDLMVRRPATLRALATSDMTSVCL